MNRYILKIFFTCLVALATFNFSYGQNYRLIDPMRVRTYAKMDSDYYFIKVDSVALQGSDTVYYFNRHLDTIPTAVCQVSEGDTALIGPKMIIEQDTDITHVFFNKFGDSIFIHTQVKEGDSWKVYIFPDGSYIKGYIIAKSYAGILPGVFDSLYRIKLNVYTAAGIALHDVFPDDTKMDITQNYGLVEFWPFYNFPYDTIAPVLRGITNPDSSIVDINTFHAFDFQLGNEFHYKETYYHGDLVDDETISYYKYFVLHKNQYTDSVNYSMFRARVDYDMFAGEITDTISIVDTISVTYNYSDYNYLDTLELTRLIAPTGIGFSDFFIVDTLFNGRAFKDVYTNYDYDDIDHCLEDADEVVYHEERYGDGLGILHLFDSSGIDFSHHLDVVYFQKGLDVWGTPLNFDSLGLVDVKNILTENTIKLYPNPAHNYLMLQTTDNIANSTIDIYTIDGMHILSVDNEYSNAMQIDIHTLAPGYYILHLSSEGESNITPFIKMQ